MTFESFEESSELGIPVSLFLIVYGDQPSNYWAYCDIDQPVTFGGRTYTPTTIGREKIESSGGLDNKVLEIDITPNAEVVTFYQTNQPTQVVTLTIYTGHYDDGAGDFRTVWTGRITGVQNTSRFAKISAEPIATSMRRPGLRRHYQYGCPWVLYSAECGANEAAATETAAATGTGQNFFEFADGWQGSKTKTKFANGYIKWSDLNTGATQIQSILQIQQNTPASGTDRIIVNGKTTTAGVGTSVEIILGCNRQESDCLNVHNNIVNFGGQPWIPKENPVGFVNQYY